MDLSVKRLASDASTLFGRALQLAEEKLAQADKTELDPNLEDLLARAEMTRQWTERIIKRTEVLIQPNPRLRMEGLLYEMLERDVPRHMNTHEQLGQCMIESGHELGPGTAYGKALITCGEIERLIGGVERKLIQSLTIGFLTPLRSFVECNSETVSREGRLLESRRLDLDVAKSRLKRAKIANDQMTRLNSTPPSGEEYRANFSYMLSFLHAKWLKMWAAEVAEAEAQLRQTQDDFDRQAETTRLLLEGTGSTHAHHLCCLNDFVEAQATYYTQCCMYMVELQRQLGSYTPKEQQPSPCTLSDASLPSLPEPTPFSPPVPGGSPPPAPAH